MGYSSITKIVFSLHKYIHTGIDVVSKAVMYPPSWLLATVVAAQPVRYCRYSGVIWLLR